MKHKKLFLSTFSIYYGLWGSAAHYRDYIIKLIYMFYQNNQNINN